MSSVQILTDQTDLDAALKIRAARNAIGKALGRAYPRHPWLVSMSSDGTVATVMCPKISTEYGMVIHCNRPIIELEQRAVRMGGELLERFNVSRVVADFDHVARKKNGQALHGAAGGV